ncbi:MAG: hypothetical protein EOO27_13205 [Comamonadaceae bacterium]|nr:MAG: hypothetical protein EOO27_13205 [Comamonadaceae bacterium]
MRPHFPQQESWKAGASALANLSTRMPSQAQPDSWDGARNMAGLSSAELLEKALNGESLDGDDAGQGDQGNQGNNDGEAGGAGTAADAAGQGDKGEQEQGKTGAEQATGEEPKGAPIASKSGNYTIPYERLETARERAKTLEGENESLRAQLADLTAKQQANLGKAEDGAQARADAGQAQTKADQNLDAAKSAIAQGVEMSLFGTFSEEDIAKGIVALNQRTREELRTELRAEMQAENAKALKPLQERDAKEAKDGHYSSIFEKHPDANDIVQSTEFDAWKKGLPGYARGAVEAAFHPDTGGTAAEVIEIFDTFKAATGKAAAPSAKDEGKPAPEVQRRVPHSLSEAGGDQHQDVAQQVMASAGTNPNALIERMQDMTPEQIERLLNAV